MHTPSAKCDKPVHNSRDARVTLYTQCDNIFLIPKKQPTVETNVGDSVEPTVVANVGDSVEPTVAANVDGNIVATVVGKGKGRQLNWPKLKVRKGLPQVPAQVGDSLDASASAQLGDYIVVRALVPIATQVAEAVPQTCQVPEVVPQAAQEGYQGDFTAGDEGDLTQDDVTTSPVVKKEAGKCSGSH